MGESELVGRELTAEELITEVERMRRGVMDGSVPIFYDGESAYSYWSERSGS